MNFNIYLYAFLFSGALCFLAQLLYEYSKLTPGHIVSMFVVFGVLLETFEIYDFYIEHCGGGALTPITNFGHTLAHSALEGAREEGFLGILKGLFKNASGVISAVVVLGVVSSLIFKPRPE